MHPQCYSMQQQQLYLQHYLYLHYTAILTLRSSNIRNVTHTYITQLYLHYAAVTSAMLLNAAAATILTALLILTLRSYTYITQQ